MEMDFKFYAHEPLANMQDIRFHHTPVQNWEPRSRAVAFY